MRVLVIGATGLLGQALIEHWRRDQSSDGRRDEVVGASSRDGDIRDAAQVHRLVETHRPDWIVLTAAITDVDACETNPSLAEQVNAHGPENVARAARDSGASVLYVSTDYVFDGEASRPYEPDDPIHPLSVYGRTKAEGEAAVRATAPRWCMVRTSWVFGTARKSFADAILERAKTQNEIGVVADQIGTPSYNRDVAAAIRELVRAEAEGVFHAANTGACSRFDFATELLMLSGLGHVQIKPLTTAEFPRPARRPKFSPLSSAGLGRFGITMRTWQEAARAYVAERSSASPAAEAAIPASAQMTRRAKP